MSKRGPLFTQDRDGDRTREARQLAKDLRAARRLKRESR